ncbi:MAG: T9SS type A sorting domain-containing protein [Calditrichaeota bacterium]|nr:T9SS type A sorting domain-containing protein [Calditrichota bacterium]
MKKKKSILVMAWLVFGASYALGQQWEKQTAGLPSGISMAAVISAVNEQIAVLASDRNIFRTMNGGKNWQEINAPEDVMGTVVDIALPDSAKIWIATSGGQIFSTPNAGDFWVKQFEDTSLVNFMNYIEMFDDQTGIAMGDNAAAMTNPDVPAIFLSTTDGGQNWVSVNDSAFGGYSGDTWRRIDFVNPNVGYFFASGLNPQRLYKTRDGGHTWQATNFPTYLQVFRFFDENVGLAISKTHEIWRTLDGGESWESFSTPQTQWGDDVEFDPDNPANVWMTDQKKIYFSSDTGKTWIEQFDRGGSDLEFVNGYNGWGVGMYGVYRFQESSSVVAEEKKNLVRKFALMQNFPNPFNATTRVRFSLMRSMHISLDIFDLNGRLIENLESGYLAAGLHEIIWNGERFSSGTYFCRLRSEKSEQVRKILLLK